MWALAPTDIAFCDANVVAHVYRANLRGDVADPWRMAFEAVPSSRRVVDEVVLWELGRYFRGSDWEEWRHRHLQRRSLEPPVVRPFVRLFDRVHRPTQGLGGPADGMIAAHCLVQRRWVLMTMNVRDFEMVPDLRLFVPP